ncbi:MAG: hypothetical protein ACKOTD_08360 [Phycisphaerales bacterium]
MPVRLPHARSRLPLVLLAAGIASAAGRIPPEPAAAFVPPAPVVQAATRAAIVPGGVIDLPTPTPSAHASSIAVRPDGTGANPRALRLRAAAVHSTVWSFGRPSGRDQG